MTSVELQNIDTLTTLQINDKILGERVAGTTRQLSFTKISDSAAKPLLEFTAVASAVNNIILSNNSTTLNPSIGATGNDTNISIDILSKGTGSVNLKSTSGSAVKISSGTGYQHTTTFSVPTTAASRTITVPDYDFTMVGTTSTGTTGQVLTSSGSSSSASSWSSTPRLSGINDTNGNEVLSLPATSSAVNYLTISNSATGSPVTISATGGDANPPLAIQANGGGAISLGEGSYTAGSIIPVQITETNTANYGTLAIGNWSNNSLGGGISFLKSRATTVGSASSAVSTNDVVANLRAYADTGSSYSAAAMLQFSVSGSVSSDIAPGSIYLYTTNSSGVLTLGATLDSTQNLVLANALTVPNGGTQKTSFTAYTPIVGGTTSTGALQSMASAGSAGQIMRSGGASAVPTWSTATYPSTAGTSGKILVSDGTNWVASTETYAAPSTSGKIMQSDGTNWTSATPTGTGTPVLATSPTLVTPTLGAATATSINFGGSSLSTYVTGTYTPTLFFGAGNTGITYSTNTGIYTRVGDLVTFAIAIVLTSKGSSTGTATIANALPIATKSSSIAQTWSILVENLTTTTTPVVTYAPTNSTTITPLRLQNPGASSVITDTGFANNTGLYITGSYIV